MVLQGINKNIWVTSFSLFCSELFSLSYIPCDYLNRWSLFSTNLPNPLFLYTFPPPLYLPVLCSASLHCTSLQRVIGQLSATATGWWKDERVKRKWGMEEMMRRDCNMKSKIKRPWSSKMSANCGATPTSRRRERRWNVRSFTSS